jgi:mono/diheme cytochrome c family protein
MKDEQKKSILEKYKIALQRGERFWPDSIYKDLIVSFGIFIVLILLATFVGVPGTPRANPSDTSYVPRPEWYFLFLFKFLALYGQIPVLGKIEWIATAVVPGLAVLVLFVLPLTDRGPYRHYSRRLLALTVMAVFVVTIVVLTMIADIPTTTLALPQFLAGLVIPGTAILVLAILSLAARKSPQRAGRVQLWVGGIASALTLVLGVVLVIVARPAAAEAGTQLATTLTEQIAQGQDLWSVNCVQCHGPEGEGGVIQGVVGLDGFKMKAIHSQDEMYTRTDETLVDIISYGQPNLGMQPFSKTYGGELTPDEINSIVTFMRYTWDDRAELPPGTTGLASIPVPGANEVPSYDVHIAPLIKRYCVSCHSKGKQNNNYLLTSYDEMLQTGDNAPVMTAGDAKSLLLQLITGHESTDPKTGNKIRQMPPTKLLDQQYIDVLTRWVLAGMPQTADQAKALSPQPTGSAPAPALSPTGTPGAGAAGATPTSTP